MAFNNQGVDVTVNSFYVPDDYTLPAVTTFDTDGVATWEKTLSVDRATVSNADRATTFGNIIDDVAIGISKQCEDIVKEWNDGAVDNVEMYVDFYDIDSNVPRGKSNAFYTDAADAFLPKVRIYARITA